MSDANPPKKRGPGRPPRKEPPVCYTLRFTQKQAAYLSFLAKEAGLAPHANGVAKLFVDAELKRLMTGRFHERVGGFPTEIDDSAD